MNSQNIGNIIINVENGLKIRIIHDLLVFWADKHNFDEQNIFKINYEY